MLYLSPRESPRMTVRHNMTHLTLIRDEGSFVVKRGSQEIIKTHQAEPAWITHGHYQAIV